MTDSRIDGTVWHFSQSVHADDEKGRFSELLRNVATTVDGLGKVEVVDMTFQHEVGPEPFLTVTVYYDRLDPFPLRVISSDRFGTAGTS